MGAAIVRGDDLDVLVRAAVAASYSMRASGNRTCRRRTAARARAPTSRSLPAPDRAARRCPSAAIALVEETLVVALELVVEHDAPTRPPWSRRRSSARW